MEGAEDIQKREKYSDTESRNLLIHLKTKSRPAKKHRANLIIPSSLVAEAAINLV